MGLPAGALLAVFFVGRLPAVRLSQNRLKAGEMQKTPNIRSNPLEDGLLLSSEVARLLRLSEQTLANWRYLGSGPPFLRVGASVRYRWQDVSSWLDERACSSTADLGR